MRRALGSTVLAIALTACRGGGAGVDASVDARVLVCAAPLRIALAPSTHPPNTGIPFAAIAWTGNSCALYEDETHPDAVLIIADTTGAWFDSGIVASADNNWSIAESTLSSSPTTYVTRVPTGTVLHFVMESDATRVGIDLRIDAGTLTLLAMSEL